MYWTKHILNDGEKNQIIETNSSEKLFYVFWKEKTSLFFYFHKLIVKKYNNFSIEKI